MARQLSILNIGGHPKDAIMYAGGTLAKHASNGDRVCTLTPTHGLSHHGRALDDYKKGKQVDLGALIEERKQELIEAAAELGVSDVRFLGHDDDIVLPREEIIEEIADVIGEVRPDIIITHWPHDTVAAHANSTQMTLLAMEAASCIRPGKPAPRCSPGLLPLRPGQDEPPRELPAAQPDYGHRHHRRHRKEGRRHE